MFLEALWILLAAKEGTEEQASNYFVQFSYQKQLYQLAAALKCIFGGLLGSVFM